MIIRLTTELKGWTPGHYDNLVCCNNKIYEKNIWVTNSATRRRDYFSIFGHLQQSKFAEEHWNLHKVDSKFCQILNKAFKYCQRLIFFACGKISPNLVILVTKLNHLISSCLNTLAVWPDGTIFECSLPYIFMQK